MLKPFPLSWAPATRFLRGFASKPKVAHQKVNQLEGFKALDIPSFLWTRLVPMGYLGPTPAQKSAIPLIMTDNQNVVIHDAPGTGKTLAYLLPLCSRLDNYANHLQAIVVVPTEALAHQVYSVAKELWGKGKRSRADHPLHMLCVPHSVNIVPPNLSVKSVTIQISQDRYKKTPCPHVLFGTPFEVLKAIQTNRWDTSRVRYIVFDEIDRLLLEQEMIHELLSMRSDDIDKGKVKEISEGQQKGEAEGKRQTQIVLVSATIDQRVRELIAKFQLETQVASPGDERPLLSARGLNKIAYYGLPKQVHHYMLLERFDNKQSRTRQKLSMLLKVIRSLREQSRPKDHPVNAIMIFFSMQDQVTKLLKRRIEAELKLSTVRLCNWESNAHRLDGLRLRTAYASRGRMLRVASRRVASDVILCSDEYSRGMDVKGVSHVINYDVPKNTIQYLHRAGRVGRLSSKDGFAATVLTILPSAKLRKLHDIQKNLKIPVIQELRFNNGRLRLPGLKDRFDMTINERILEREVFKPKQKYTAPPERKWSYQNPAINWEQPGLQRPKNKNLFSYGTRTARGRTRSLRKQASARF